MPPAAGRHEMLQCPISACGEIERNPIKVAMTVPAPRRSCTIYRGSQDGGTADVALPSEDAPHPSTDRSTIFLDEALQRQLLRLFSFAHRNC